MVVLCCVVRCGRCALYLKHLGIIEATYRQYAACILIIDSITQKRLNHHFQSRQGESIRCRQELNSDIPVYVLNKRKAILGYLLLCIRKPTSISPV